MSTIQHNLNATNFKDAPKDLMPELTTYFVLAIFLFGIAQFI